MSNCSDGQFRNKVTGQCGPPCNVGEVVNTTTGQCELAVSSPIGKCKEGEVFNVTTGLCEASSSAGSSVEMGFVGFVVLLCFIVGV